MFRLLVFLTGCSLFLGTGCSLFEAKETVVTHTEQPPIDEALASPVVASVVTQTTQPARSPTATATPLPTSPPTLTPTQPLPAEPAVTEQPEIDETLDALVTASEDCPVTTPALSTDLASIPSDYPAPVWFYNPNRTIWAGSAPPYQGRWYGGVWHKVLWWRQQGMLQVEGNRLDGEAPPLEAEIPCCYGDSGQQASGLFFPLPGCWEVVAQAEQETLRFVIYAYPVEYAPAYPPYGNQYGETLAESIQEADAVVLGEVETSTPFGNDFHRRTLRIIQSWKGDVVPDEQIVVLQGQPIQEFYAQPLEIGEQYLLILEQRPNNLWRIIKEYRSVGQVVDGHVQGLGQPSQWRLWNGESLEAVDENLRGLVDR